MIELIPISQHGITFFIFIGYYIILSLVGYWCKSRLDTRSSRDSNPRHLDRNLIEFWRHLLTLISKSV